MIDAPGVMGYLRGEDARLAQAVYTSEALGKRFDVLVWRVFSQAPPAE